jgi:hypothetical protein
VLETGSGADTDFHLETKVDGQALALAIRRLAA